MLPNCFPLSSNVVFEGFLVGWYLVIFSLWLWSLIVIAYIHYFESELTQKKTPNQNTSEAAVTVDRLSTTKPPFHIVSLSTFICDVLDNYSLHLLFCTNVTMHNGENSVLIRNAGILICWRLSESLICHSDQNLNWFNWWIIATSFSRSHYTVCFQQLGILCLMQLVERESFKGHKAQISAGHMFCTMWGCMCWYTCQGYSAERGWVCVWTWSVFVHAELYLHCVHPRTSRCGERSF